jgi:hypothetical protein
MTGLASLNARVRRLESVRAAASAVLVVRSDQGMSRDELDAKAEEIRQQRKPGWRGAILMLPALLSEEAWEAQAAAWQAEHRPAQALAAPPIPLLPAPSRELPPLPAPTSPHGVEAVVIRAPPSQGMEADVIRSPSTASFIPRIPRS